MSSLFCTTKKNQQLSIMISTSVRAFLYSKPRFGGFPHCENPQLSGGTDGVIRLFSSSSEDKQSFTASYLVNSCGLSLQTAKSVSMKAHFSNTKNPDSVLSLLRSYGFTHMHITKLVTKCPQVLNMNLEKVLKPKLEFYESIGISKDHLAKFVSGNPCVILPSLENQLIPFCSFIKNAISNDEKVVKVYMQVARFTGKNVQTSFVPNIALLKQIGVRETTISTIVSHIPSIIFRDRHVFKKTVNEVCSMGFDPTKSNFIHAMCVFFNLSKSSLKLKMEIYKTWGWSENELDFVLKNNPQVFRVSEEKISNTMDFLVNKMGFKSADIARCPSPFTYSLETRIVPRCLVYKVLLLRGLLRTELGHSSLIKCPPEKFVEKFVAAYEKEVPQLWKIYQGKIGISELGYTSEDLYGAKPSL